MLKRLRRSRSPRYPARWPTVLVACAGLVLAAAVLVAVGALVGGDRPSLAKPLDALARATAKPASAAFVVCASVLFGAWCFRRLWQEFLTWWPGQIEVPVFAVDEGWRAIDPVQATTWFRQRLATLRLQAPTPVPGAAGEGDFLDVLGRGALDTAKPLASLVTLARAAKPTHVWQVFGTVTKRDQAPCFGVTIHVVRLPSRGNPPETLWGRTPREAIDVAADHATATILSHTRQCRSPWVRWRRRVLPGELLASYEDAAGLEAAGRYDEALDAYYRALELDPFNMVIRLRVGQLQEKLGLYLDAVATYQGMLELNRSRGARMRHVDLRPAARVERFQAMLAARYRHVVLLGGNEFAEQWQRRMAPDPQASGDWTLRDERRRELRSRLVRQLESQLCAAAGAPERCGKRPAKALLSDAGPGATHSDVFARELKELLAMAAIAELVREVYPRAWLSPRTVTPKGCRLTRRCIEVRLEHLRSLLTDGKRGAWPPAANSLRRSVRRIGLPFGLHGWQPHYNAACVYALPLAVDPKLGTGSHGELAEAALDELQRATAHADSAFLASKRAWILSEDPDLDGLRADCRFEDFEAVFLPGAAQTPRRPRNVNKLEAARYVRDLLVASARGCERAWHEHEAALATHPDVHVMLDWWVDECRAWHAVHQVVSNGRHWRSRLDLIREMERRCDRDIGAPLEVAFHGYENEPLPPPFDACRAEKAADRAEHRLGAIDVALRGPGRDDVLMPDIDTLQQRLRDLDARADEPRWDALEELCHQHAALWQRLGEWLAVDFEGDDRHQHQAFATALGVTRRLWSQAYEAWRGGGRAARRRRFARANGATRAAAA